MLKNIQNVIDVLDNIPDLEQVAENKYYHEPTLTMVRIHTPENPFDSYTDIICQVTITSGKALIPVRKFLMQVNTPVNKFINYINSLIGGGIE